MPESTATAWVTSHLACGASPPNVQGPIRLTDDLLEAVQGLQDGETVVLPQGRFDLAEQVLQSIGASPEHVDFSLRYAQGLLPGMSSENSD